MLTVADYFCGAGGSSTGMEQVPGVRVVMASNHWQLAVDTHNANFPHADHDREDITRIDPRRHPRTDIAWFSPECTNWSVAKGRKCDYDGKPVQLDLFGAADDDEPLPDEAAQRSRMLMQDVPRFTEVHHYRAVVVENVTDVLKWDHLDEWLHRMTLLGYRHRIVILNSAFATALGPGAPQLRDRVYFVFWRAEYPAPDFAKWTRPRARCPRCGDVAGVYTPKPGPRRIMRYGAQYTYRCPSSTCRGGIVQPYALPAATVIDWTVPGQRIGDRAIPLRPKTLARIEAGLRRHAQPITVEVAGNTFERRPGVRTWPVDYPLTAQTTTATKAMACPPLLVPCGGGRNILASTAAQPMRTRTSREIEALVTAPLLVPLEARDGKQARTLSEPLRAQTARAQDALIVPLRNNGVARPAATHPLVAFAAGGTHQSLIVRNNTARGDAGQMATRLDEPLRALTTAGHQSLLRWDHLLYGYDTGTVRDLHTPLPAQTTVQGDALLGTTIDLPVDVNNCTFRMLTVEEIRDGMAFTPGYILLGGSKRANVRMLGNAVTPPAARDLVAALVEAITGDPIDLPA
ncbi:DNA cytosine methyltransferase [Dactylosporangium sp. AC04546]|uniref:DNA cytosine methyltransferase n=1 Tax=Dactylosporangium sp. AC04546 TaxID=2862460 RepID=UPI001EDE9A29|nr:DNA cytosine methyltransferase [Dactylosporangium sp. AC04546]WVK82017.1 DNA cytosine methyltransferase [Dactylosporangium sp. AC04546]